MKTRHTHWVSLWLGNRRLEVSAYVVASTPERALIAALERNPVLIPFLGLKLRKRFKNYYPDPVYSNPVYSNRVWYRDKGKYHLRIHKLKANRP